jgi:hypothetical protein
MEGIADGGVAPFGRLGRAAGPKVGQPAPTHERFRNRCSFPVNSFAGVVDQPVGSGPKIIS